MGQTHVRGGHFFKEDIGVFDAPFFNLTAEAAAVRRREDKPQAFVIKLKHLHNP